MPRFIHIFKTEIKTEECLGELTLALNSNSNISRWFIDMNDIDKVLKVETESLSEKCIIALAQERKINCEALPD